MRNMFSAPLVAGHPYRRQSASKRTSFAKVCYSNKQPYADGAADNYAKGERGLSYPPRIVGLFQPFGLPCPTVIHYIETH